MEGELPTMFEDKESIETVEENTECETEQESGMVNLAFNNLDRGRSQLIKDQEMDVTLVKALDRASQKAHGGADGYFFDNSLLMHCKFSKEMHNVEKYVDRVVQSQSPIEMRFFAWGILSL